MHKIKILLCLIIFNVPLFAQYNFDFVCTSDTFQTGTDYFIYYFRLTNTGSVPDSYAFDCRVLDSVPGWFELYCAGGQCAEPGIILYDYLAPMEIDSGIDISVYPATGAWGTEKINLCVWSLSNQNLRDSINVYAEMEQSISEKNNDCKNLQRIVAYPNPFQQNLIIKVADSQKSVANIKIYDVSGRLVKSFNPASSILWSGDDSNGHQVAAGVYIILWEVDGKKWETNIIKCH